MLYNRTNQRLSASYSSATVTPTILQLTTVSSKNWSTLSSQPYNTISDNKVSETPLITSVNPASTLSSSSSVVVSNRTSTTINSTLAKFYRLLAIASFNRRPMATISKSYATDDPIVKYTTSVSLKPDPLQEQLTEYTIKNAPMSRMLGAPEVLQFGQNLIRLIGAKRALDIGTYTGASALAWALAIPADGQVLSMDIDHENLNRYGKPLIDTRPEVAKKIDFRLGPALDTLDALLSVGQNGTWDFAFIDADKENYPNYYEKCVQLLRPGGVILIDNALWGGSVIFEEKDESTEAIDKTNHIIASDKRVDNMLLNLGDGTHVIFKKHQ